jgi:hypothetical protein
MAETQLPQIRVLGFKSTFEMLPVKGDPITDEVDRLGYKLDAKGNRIRELQEEHWVSYSPSHSPLNTATNERVRHMIPDESRMGTDTDGEKLRFMTHRWAQIEPAYEAFKNGRDIPLSGTPLGAWNGIIAEQAEVLRQSGIRTVEEVAELSESQLERVRLPNMRDLRSQAKLFLENSDKALAAKREADKDAMIEAMSERMAAMEELLEQATKPAKRGRKPADEDQEEAA